MNYTYTRNPWRLVEQLGFTGADIAPSQYTPDEWCLASAAAERRFMSKLHTLSAEDLRTLVVVVGGFMDGRLGHAYGICRRYPPELREVHDVYFREHPEGAAVRELVELYRHRGKRVVLIGHSWGADAAVHAVTRKTAAKVDLLVTLDPVSRKMAPAKALHNVGHWHNVHLDYRVAPYLDSSNMVARVGGPWERVAVANENIPCPLDLNHADAAAMFDRFVLPVLR